MSKSEEHWFTENSSKDSILNNSLRDRAEILRKPWKILELPTISQASLVRREANEKIVGQQSAEACLLGAKASTRERQLAHPGVEIVTRDQGPVTKYSNLEAPTICEVVACSELCNIRCSVFECGTSAKVIKIIRFHGKLKLTSDHLFGDRQTRPFYVFYTWT